MVLEPASEGEEGEGEGGAVNRDEEAQDDETSRYGRYGRYGKAMGGRMEASRWARVGRIACGATSGCGDDAGGVS